MHIYKLACSTYHKQSANKKEEVSYYMYGFHIIKHNTEKNSTHRPLLPYIPTQCMYVLRTILRTIKHNNKNKKNSTYRPLLPIDVHNTCISFTYHKAQEKKRKKISTHRPLPHHIPGSHPSRCWKIPRKSSIGQK